MFEICEQRLVRMRQVPFSATDSENGLEEDELGLRARGLVREGNVRLPGRAIEGVAGTDRLGPARRRRRKSRRPSGRNWLDSCFVRADETKS